MNRASPGQAPVAVPPLTAAAFLRVSFALHVAFTVLRFLYVWLDDLVRDEPGTWLPRLIEESSGATASFLLSITIFALWQRAPLRGAGTWHRLPAYLACAGIISIAATSMMWGGRVLLFPLAGLGAYDYGRMPLRYVMEAATHLVGFATIVGALALAEALRERTARERMVFTLERDLLTSQLQNLRLQLQPHFLFNALNTIAAKVHDDPVVADALIGRLAELLRGALHANDRLQVTLREELEVLSAYLDLMQARFGSRLTVELQVDPGARDLLVPPLLLQPLVENAIRHGGLESRGQVAIALTITRHQDALSVTVADDGPGAPTDRDPLVEGTGLSTTARRLALLHGDRASLQAGNAPHGGFVVRLTLPATPAE